MNAASRVSVENRPFAQVAVRRAFPFGQGDGCPCQGLIDTGGQVTLAHSDVAARLGLRVADAERPLELPNGTQLRAGYVDLGLHVDGLRWKTLRVRIPYEWHFGDNCEAVIGMDYLGQFDFAVRRGEFAPLTSSTGGGESD